MFSVANIGGWVLEIPMPHHFETRLGISTMSVGMFVTKIIKSIVFIATIITMTATQQNHLASPFKFKAISFLSLPHENKNYGWISRALDVKLRKMKIYLTAMKADSGYFTDGTKMDEMDEDIVGKLETAMAKELFNNKIIKVKDTQDCEDFVKKIDFMYKMKSGTLYPLVDRLSFNRSYASYAITNKAPDEVEAIDKFIIFLDIFQTTQMVSSISMTLVRFLILFLLLNRVFNLYKDKDKDKDKLDSKHISSKDKYDS